MLPADTAVSAICLRRIEQSLVRFVNRLVVPHREICRRPVATRRNLIALGMGYSVTILGRENFAGKRFEDRSTGMAFLQLQTSVHNWFGGLIRDEYDTRINRSGT